MISDNHIRVLAVLTFVNIWKYFALSVCNICYYFVYIVPIEWIVQLFESESIIKFFYYTLLKCCLILNFMLKTENKDTFFGKSFVKGSSSSGH